MVIVAVLASALWRAGPVVPVAVTIVALRRPVLALVALGAWVAVSRMQRRGGPTPDDEAVVLAGLVAELEGGASPRAALVAVAGSDRPIDLSGPARLIGAGMHSTRIARLLAELLPHNGRLAAAAWALAGDSGAPAATVMGSLASRAAERGRLDRERRASTAQARATAWVLAGLPLVALTAMAATGRIGSGPTLPIVVAGVVLQALGLGLVVLMVRASS